MLIFYGLICYLQTMVFLLLISVIYLFQQPFKNQLTEITQTNSTVN
jgi:hypothetical protein